MAGVKQLLVLAQIWHTFVLSNFQMRKNTNNNISSVTIQNVSTDFAIIYTVSYQ